ncbi:MAG: spore maturation protein [Ignavibacteriales bacterium]|nr:MAG: spore maturation protein [Ignavibacteriales bacterium]
MLNYVWLALIVLGIGTALVTDLSDSNKNKFANDKSIEVSVRKIDSENPKLNYEVILGSGAYKNSFNDESENDITFKSFIKTDSNKTTWAAILRVNDSATKLLKEIAEASGEKDDITATIKSFSLDSTGKAVSSIKLESVSFIKLKNVTDEVLNYASVAVNIALGLIGIMALWLGVMKIAEEAGLISLIAKIVKPITKRLFPDVPPDHPSIGSMIMNISANTLGLGNAATPFGLKAMEELNQINPDKTTASNAMITFLAINTAGITLIPATAIAIRAASGSSDPAIIIGTSLFASCCATIAGVTSAKIFEKFSSNNTSLKSQKNTGTLKIIFSILAIIIAAFVILYFGGSGLLMVLSSLFNPESVKNVIQTISFFAIPFLIISFIVYGAVKKVKVYEQFIEGAKEGFNIAIRIIPYLVAMLMAIGIFRAGGAMDWLVDLLEPVLSMIGMPAEALPMALMRPLSGSGSLGIMTEIISVHGADSFMGVLVSTFYGSTETTFYVLAVYFGAVNIKKTRHALPAGLIADIIGILAALFIVKQLF